MSINLTTTFPYVPRNQLAWWFQQVLPSVLGIRLEPCVCGQHTFMVFDIWWGVDNNILPILAGNITCQAELDTWLQQVVGFLPITCQQTTREALGKARSRLPHVSDPEGCKSTAAARQAVLGFLAQQPSSAKAALSEPLLAALHYAARELAAVMEVVRRHQKGVEAWWDGSPPAEA